MPEMLRSIVDGLLAQEADLVVVGRSAAGDDALLQARAEQAEMLIIAEGEHSGSKCLGAILSGPPLSILAIARNGRDGTAVSLAARQVDLDRSGRALSEAVRCAVAKR
jgi:pyruvate/2-oxoglutarate dehydrogenase complex dihydrolipoamide dehydrogenase (E3) component